jgi:hypothetical protein
MRWQVFFACRRIQHSQEAFSIYGPTNSPVTGPMWQSRDFP